MCGNLQLFRILYNKKMLIKCTHFLNTDTGSNGSNTVVTWGAFPDL